MNVTIITTFSHKIYTGRQELIEQLKLGDHKLSVIGPEKQEIVEPILDKHGIKYLQAMINRVNLNPIRELLAINSVRKLIKLLETNSILIYGVRMIPSCVIAAKLARVGTIVCVVNGTGNLFEIRGLKGIIARIMSFPLLKLSFHLSNFIFFQNKDNLRMMVEKKLISTNKANMINGSGVNLEKFASTELPNEHVFLMIGRITLPKGVIEYINAARIVKGIYNNAKFILVGPKDETDKTMNWVELKNAINDCIIDYHGEVEDVRVYIKQSRIFVLPSYHEGTPRTVLEAMAMGRPIITTDAPGCRETIINGVNGFKIPVKDTTSLVEKMIWMIEHEDDVKNMGYESRRICEEKFDVYKVNRFMLDTIGLS